MISTNEVSFSDKMGGKESLSALGWSRTHRKEIFEVWERCDGQKMISFTRDRVLTDRWLAEGMRWARSEGMRPLLLTADEMRAATKRIEELEAGDAE